MSQVQTLKKLVKECHQLLSQQQEGKAKKLFKQAAALMMELRDVEDEVAEDVQELWYGAYIELEDWFALKGIKKSGR